MSYILSIAVFALLLVPLTEIAQRTPRSLIFSSAPFGHHPLQPVGPGSLIPKRCVIDGTISRALKSPSRLRQSRSRREGCVFACKADQVLWGRAEKTSEGLAGLNRPSPREAAAGVAGLGLNITPSCRIEKVGFALAKAGLRRRPSTVRGPDRRAKEQVEFGARALERAGATGGKFLVAPKLGSFASPLPAAAAFGAVPMR